MQAALLLTSMLPLSAIGAGQPEPGAPGSEALVASNAEAAAEAGAATADDATAADAPDAAAIAAADAAQIETVLVRTRNRAEQQQDVPVPISAISGKELERDFAVNLGDFARRATNVQAAELNSRRSSISIRGVGKNVTGEEFESPIGVIVDDVFQPYVGSSWTDYADLESIEVDRGPQGTLLGKNTTLGVLNIRSRLPSFASDYGLDFTYGSRKNGKIRGFGTGAVVDGLLAYRASFFVDTGEGSIENVNENRSTWYDRNRAGGRLQFLLTPTDDLTARVIVARSRARENINASPVVADPTTYLDGTARSGATFTSRLARDWFGGGYTPLFEKFKIDVDYVTPSIDEQNSASAEITWKIGEHTELTSITAYVDNLFVADNDFDLTPFDIRRGGGARTDQQAKSEELRLSSTIGDSVDYQIGTYLLHNRYNYESRTYLGEDAGAFYATNPQYATLNADAAGRELLRLSLDNWGVNNLRRPVTDSYAIFGQANWHLTERATLTAGVRETWEKKSNTWEFVTLKPGADLTAVAAANGASAAQLAAAQAIRTGQAGSSVKYGPQRSETDSSSSTSALLSPSYKLTENTLLYLSIARGVKSGAVSWNSNDGSEDIVKPEVAYDGELGIKSTLFDRRVLFDLNLYRTEIHDFQTTLVIPDATSSSGTRQTLGNAKRVTLTGVELDGQWAPVRYLTVRLGGAYNLAEYASFDNSPCNTDIAATVPATCDYSGKTLPAAPKWSASLGIDYQSAVAGKAIVHAGVNDAYASRQNASLSLDEYGWQSSRQLIDATIGIGTIDEKYDISLLAKNLLDKVYAVDSSGFSSTSGVTYRWADRRFVGVNLSAKF